MAEVTKEMILVELLKLDDKLERVEQAMKATSVELNRTLWELEMGRQKIDRSRRAYEHQVERRRASYN
jgi:hypothetical protein